MTQTAIDAVGLGKLVDRPSIEAAPAHRGRIPELDGLRGLAILLVILGHYIGNADRAPFGFWMHRILGAFGAGWVGVDLFFVLSGFLIGGILVDAREAPHYFRAFYMRRVYRILPIYYLWILIYAVLVGGAMWLLPGRYPFGAKDLEQIPIQILFLRNVFLGGMPTFALTWFMPTWSLGVEEQFYLVAPPIIRLFSRRNLVKALVATIAVAPVVRLLLFRYLGPWGSAASLHLTVCRADELAWGILLAIGWRDEGVREFLRARQGLVRTILAVLGLGAVAMIPWLARPNNWVTVVIGLSWLPVLFGTMLLTALSQTGGMVAAAMRWSPLRRLGEVSYCVYIIHNAANELSHRALLGKDPEIYDVKGVAVTLFALAMTLVVAALSWRFFEKPMIRRGHEYSFGTLNV